MSRPVTPPPDRTAKSPRLKAPPGACDSHFHVFGPQDRFPYIDPRPLDAEDCPLEDLLDLHQRLGLERGVVVQTALYGNDNACLLDALNRCPERLRGIAAVSPDLSDAALQGMTDAGVVGNRFSFMRSPDIDNHLVGRLHEFGWHPQFWFEGEDQALIERAPNRVLWGSDWPHPNWFKPMPNDADLLDLLLDWAADDAARQRILVDNPAELFGFGARSTPGG